MDWRKPFPRQLCSDRSLCALSITSILPYHTADPREARVHEARFCMDKCCNLLCLGLDHEIIALVASCYNTGCVAHLNNHAGCWEGYRLVPVILWKLSFLQWPSITSCRDFLIFFFKFVLWSNKSQKLNWTVRKFLSLSADANPAEERQIVLFYIIHYARTCACLLT